MTPDELRVLARSDLNLLRAFEALVDERSVSLAAARLSVGQPAMSATLQRLRRLFGDPLLVREGGVLEPTPLAESMYQPVAQALHSIVGTIDAQRSFDPATEARTFRLMAGDDVILLLLEPLLRALRTEAPQVTVHVLPVGADVAGRLRRREVDLAVTSQVAPDDTGRLRDQALLRDRYVCVVGSAHPAVRDRLTWAQIAAHPLLVHDDGFLPAAVSGWLRRGSQLEGDHEGLSVDIVTQSAVVTALLLEGSTMISLLPSRLASRLRARARIRTLEPPAALPTLVQTMYWDDSVDAEPGQRWLRHRLADAAASLEEQPG